MNVGEPATADVATITTEATLAELVQARSPRELVG